MDSLHTGLQSHPGLWVASFSLLFRLVRRLSFVLPLPKAVEHDTFRTWKWRNLSVSLVHSMLTGPWAITCMLLWPEMLQNIYAFQAPLCYLLASVSTGYFIQDAVDIIFSGHARGSWEFLLHHALVIWCFLYSLYTQRYVAGVVVALFVEVNSIFLHARLLLKLASAQSTPLYTLNRLLNLLTYVVFRLGSQAYLTWYILANLSWLDHGGCFLCTMMLMNIMILVYFYRLLRADVFRRSGTHVTHNGTNHSKKFLND